jgi:hypothetical protein
LHKIKTNKIVFYKRHIFITNGEIKIKKNEQHTYDIDYWNNSHLMSGMLNTGGTEV